MKLNLGNISKFHEKMIDHGRLGVEFVELIADVDRWEPCPYLHHRYAWGVSLMEDMCDKEQFGNADYDNTNMPILTPPEKKTPEMAKRLNL